MNFSDEEYVRLYVSDTATWNLLEWEGQALLALALRKFDKSGVFDFGRHSPEKALFASLKMPIEIIKTGLTRLLDEGVWVLQTERLFWPKYIEAQTCRRSDKLRQRMSRANAKREPDVTPCDNRDNASQNVTVCHEQDIKRDIGHEMSHQARRGEARQGSGILNSGSSSRACDIECPADLKLTAEQAKVLETAMIPVWAIELLTVQFVASQVVDSKPRPLDAWLKCLSKSITSSWNDPSRRPKKPDNREKTQAPDKLEFTERHRALCKRGSIDINLAWSKFRDYQRGNATFLVDWSAAFSAELAKSVENIERSAAIRNNGPAQRCAGNGPVASFRTPQATPGPSGSKSEPENRPGLVSKLLEGIG